jgi:hypothetical protein
MRSSSKVLVEMAPDATVETTQYRRNFNANVHYIGLARKLRCLGA